MKKSLFAVAAVTAFAGAVGEEVEAVVFPPM